MVTELTLDLTQRLAFLNEIEKLKTVKRMNRTLDGRQENSAEHSWHICMVALLLAPYAKADIDMLTVLRMLLIHDIIEIDAGDTWLFAKDQNNKFEREHAAAKRLYGLLPEAETDEYIELWLAFEAKETEEAKFAAVIDSIQPLLNHLLTADPTQLSVPEALVREKKAHIESFAPSLWPVVEHLIGQGVENGLYT